jgi:hypothetical protein
MKTIALVTSPSLSDDIGRQRLLEATGGMRGGQRVDDVDRASEQYRVPALDHLGSLRLNLSIRPQADDGRPTVVADPDGGIAALFKTVARTVAVKIALRAKDLSAKFPTITVSKGT